MSSDSLHSTAGNQRHLKVKVLITGGAGFIGTNLADRLASTGSRVTIYDNLSRAGVEKNVEWLRTQHGDLIQVEVADVRDADRLRSAVHSAQQVFHLAAQVAVTSSLVDPRFDFDVNVGGTINVLEALRQMERPASLVFTSTNKVYGDLNDISLEKTRTRYQPLDPQLRLGVSENRPLAFHSPYGCSKGAADQYVLDYARSFNIPATVFRMSCIFGPHQMGTEDQGWIAHFLRQAIQEQPITIYGDGLQVRDVLFVEDLVDAFLLAQQHMSVVTGRAFNLGGGPANTISLIELLSAIEHIQGFRPDIEKGNWRRGDQQYYVSDVRSFRSVTKWSPKVGAQDGIRRLYDWFAENYPTQTHLGRGHAVLAH